MDIFTKIVLKGVISMRGGFFRRDNFRRIAEEIQAVLDKLHSWFSLSESKDKRDGKQPKR